MRKHEKQSKLIHYYNSIMRNVEKYDIVSFFSFSQQIKSNFKKNTVKVIVSGATAISFLDETQSNSEDEERKSERTSRISHLSEQNQNHTDLTIPVKR